MHEDPGGSSVKLSIRIFTYRYLPFKLINNKLLFPLITLVILVSRHLL